MEPLFDPTKSRYRYVNAENNKTYRRFVGDTDLVQKDKLEGGLGDVPAHGPYGAYLFRAEWKLKRKEIIERDRNCVICNSISVLQVHHRQYHFLVRENRFKYPWEYHEHLLITLCESCHRRGHSKFKVPIINL